MHGESSAGGNHILDAAMRPCGTSDDVITRTYAWNPRKRQFTPRQVGIAVNVLVRKGWVESLVKR